MSQNDDPGSVDPDPSFTTWSFVLSNGKKQPIGKGYFSSIFKARTDRSDTVAVKVIRMTNSSSPKELQKAIQQCRAVCEVLSKIRHPNVIQFLKSEAAVDRRQLYIFTDLIPGDSLRDRLNQTGKPFEESQVRQFLLQICIGLNFLHSRRPAVLHRDVNCSNIMLTDRGVIKLIGFGLAKTVLRKVSSQRFNKNEFALAPELLDSEGPWQCTAKADVWALGCSIIEMLTMRPPRSQASCEAVPPLPDTVSGCLRNFYSRCIRSEPEERADTVELLRHDLLTDAAARTTCSIWDDQFTSWEFILDPSGFKCLVGDGSFGRVFKALTDRYQTVAVKVINPAVCSAALTCNEWEVSIRKLRSNYEFLKRIRHPNIVKFLKLEDNSKEILLFTELIAGRSLFDLMQLRREPFHEQVVRLFLKQICSGLKFLHNCQPAIVHGSVNCSHIVLTHQGVIKLVGLEIGSDMKQIFEANLHVLPDLYNTCFTAPEQFGSLAQPVSTTKTDVWALGCTVFEMLAMQPPNGNARRELVALRVTGRDMPGLPVGASASLTDFYRRCVARSPTERPGAAELLRHRLLEPGRDRASESGFDGHVSGRDIFQFDARSSQGAASGRSVSMYQALTDKLQTLSVKVIHCEDPGEGPSGKGGNDFKTFLDEVKFGHEILASLRHRNIMQCLGLANPLKDRIHVYAELIDGLSLSDLMQRQRKPFQEAAVRKFSLQICSGVHFLHSRQPAILHRNIKCSNLVLTHLGDIKLINFSYAVQCDPVGLAVGKPCSAPHFTAPELAAAPGAEAKVTYSTKTDVWALGCSVHQLLATKPPLTELDLLRDQRLLQLPDGVSSILSSFSRRCLDRDPVNRADTADLLEHAFLQNP